MGLKAMKNSNAVNQSPLVCSVLQTFVHPRKCLLTCQYFAVVSYYDTYSPSQHHDTSELKGELDCGDATASEANCQISVSKK